MSVKNLIHELLRSVLRSVRKQFPGRRRLSPKPSAFESEIHPPHKSEICTLGISPCRGQICASANLYSPKELDCISPCRPKDGRMDALLLTTAFRGEI